MSTKWWVEIDLVMERDDGARVTIHANTMKSLTEQVSAHEPGSDEWQALQDLNNLISFSLTASVAKAQKKARVR